MKTKSFLAVTLRQPNDSASEAGKPLTGIADAGDAPYDGMALARLSAPTKRWSAGTLPGSATYTAPNFTPESADATSNGRSARPTSTLATR